MPSLLDPEIARLIRSLPVNRHVVTVPSATWEPLLEPGLHQEIFGEHDSVSISRGRIKNYGYQTSVHRCAEILLWGYPGNQRGVVGRLLPQLEQLSQVASAQYGTWAMFHAAMAPFHGIGISTMSKLAWGFGQDFGASALILDRRVIEAAGYWDQTRELKLTYNNAPRSYMDYLTTMHQTAEVGECTPEQIELFLFALGTNLV